MAVYVDNMRAKYGRLVMCHMAADSAVELHAMADAIGIKRKWFDDASIIHHYDICLSKRAMAVRLGAVECTMRELVKRFVASKLKE